MVRASGVRSCVRFFALRAGDDFGERGEGRGSEQSGYGAEWPVVADSCLLSLSAGFGGDCDAPTATILALNHPGATVFRSSWLTRSTIFLRRSLRWPAGSCRGRDIG